MSTNGCAIRYHSNDKVNGIIKELSYGDSASAYRLANLINEKGFEEFWKNDVTASKYDNLDKIPKPTLRRIIRQYRDNNTFSVKNNTKVKSNVGYYAFKSKEAYNVAKTYVGDTVYNFYTNVISEADRQQPGCVDAVKSRIKKQLKIELAKRLNKYDTNNKFDKNTPIQDLINYANKEEVSEQDKNYADLVYTAYSSGAFWHEAFQNAKVVNLGLRLTDEDVADKEDMQALEEDDINDSEQSDGVDEMTKQWDIDKTYNNFGKHVSEANKARFNSLIRLASPIYNPSGKGFKEQYDVDTSNALGVPTYHTYQEIMIELTDGVGRGGWKSIDDFISYVENIANNKKDFYGLIKLVNDMRNNEDVAYAVFKDVNKFNQDVFEIDINENSIESVQSNTRNRSERQIYYNLRNSLRNTCLELDNINLENDINDINNLIKKYKSDVEAGGNRIIKTPKGNRVVNVDVQLNDITQRIKSLYKDYFPAIDEVAIDKYIIANNNSDRALDVLTSFINSIRAAAITASENKRQQDYINSKINARNYKKRIEAIENGRNPNELIYEENKYSDEYMGVFDKPISDIIKTLAPYMSSKAELNYRNIDNNLQSGLIYNNYITNLVKSLSDPETLQLWVDEKLRSDSTEYKYSNILFDRPEQGIKGIVRIVNGKYQLTEYAPYLIHSYLLSGIRNNTNGVARDYTNMSDADYLLTGYYAFHRDMRNYSRFDYGNVDVPAVAPYLMRIPSDAPKNFAVTLPKYNTEDLHNWDIQNIENYSRPLTNKIIYNTNYNYGNAISLQLIFINNAIEAEQNFVAELIVNSGESYTVSRSKLIESKDGKALVAFLTKDDDGNQGLVWFKADYKDTRAAHKVELNNIEFLGLQKDNIDGQMLYSKLYNAVNNAYKNKYMSEHPELRNVNRNSAIFNILRNTIYGEIGEYIEAENYVATHPKSQQIQHYHYGNRNAFKITKLDKDVFDIGSPIERMLSSTGEHPFTLMSDGTVVPNSPEIREQIDQLIEQWINAYERYSIDYFRNNYGNVVENEYDSDIVDYMFNAYIANMSFDDLFEGNSKYYKDSQTFLKRAKEVQASGTSYATNYHRTQDGSNPYIQSVANTGKTINVGGRTINIRTGWNAITIKNVEKPSNLVKEIRASLEGTNLTKDQIDRLVKPFGYKEDIIDAKEDGNTDVTTTTVDDAQSYITIYEAARRIKLMGEYPRYEKLLNQLTDDTTRLEDINPHELESFIQVFKNFYYDQYYDPTIKRHVSRQIKNAEYILVPKFLKGTSLGNLAQIMIDNDIDQVNTKETSKATNYEVLEYWDEKTGEEIGNNPKFIEDAKRVKKPFSYMYLYRQQEVPQHMLDEQNKAGIQIMKKVLDNLTFSSDGTKQAADNLRAAYVANIREDFDTLMGKFGIRFDKDGNIISDNKNNHINFAKAYKLAEEQMARLGSDSNMMDYVTIRNNRTGRPVMPNIFNITASKVESVAQAQFNKAITRQKLPGWHGAQVASVGFEGKIPQLGVSEANEKLGKRVELAYHKDRNVVEILLPKWASSMLNQYDENGNLVKEFTIDDLDDKVKECIGYRIPTEGKQSVAVMKVVGFLPEWMGSTVVVPDEWVTQTGADFDIDSIYGIAYETYLGRDGRIHAYEYIDGQDEESKWLRYANYVNRNINRIVRNENTLYLTAEEKQAEYEKAKRIINELNTEEDTKFQNMIKEILNTKESVAWEQLSDSIKERLNPILQNKNIKFKDRVTAVISELHDIELNEGATDGTQAMLEVYNEIAKIIRDQIDFNQARVEDVRDLLRGAYKDYFRNAIINRAKACNLMSFDEFTSQNIEAQNTRRARNNRILDMMIEIMNSKDATAENLARSNFDDMTSGKNLVDNELGINNTTVNIYNPSTQVRFRRNAMSGAMLKAFSVTRDTANSVFNVSRAKLKTPIYVRYHYGRNGEYGAMEAFAKQAYDIREDGFVKHDGLANSKNDRNVAGELITVASSHTTAHILDAIKEGAIENENEYTFAAFKTLFDIGMDAYSAILWLRQPGISRLVNAYFESQSVFARGKYSPIYAAVKQITKELNIQINNRTVTDYDSIDVVLKALQTQYGEEFARLTNNGVIDFDVENNPINDIDIPQIEERMFGNSLSPTGKLLLDLAAILNFDFINKTATTIQQHARVLNPDRFGAKQSIFETRQVFRNIINLHDKGITDKIYVDNKDKNIPLLDAIYPGLFDKGVINPKRFLAEDRSKESAYPSVYAFLKYSTLPSIIINTNLFDTERASFVNALMALESRISGKMNKQLYTSFKSYVIDSAFKQHSDVISMPVYIDNNGNIAIDYSMELLLSSPVEDGNNNADIFNFNDPKYRERNRVYGFGYPNTVDFVAEDIHHPTQTDIYKFAKLTPAQKIIWIQKHISFGERTIFDSIEANLNDTRFVRTQGVPRHTIQFNDQDVSREALYDMFEEAFFNNNELIKLAALDIVKYAFIVEGYRFSRRAVGKLIKNSALYTERENGGTGMVDDMNNVINEYDAGRFEFENLYEDFVRSHSTIPQLPTYKIRYNKGNPDIYPVANGSGLYYFNLDDSKQLSKVIDMNIVSQNVRDGRTYDNIDTNYINIVTRGNKTTLYKVVAIRYGDNIKDIFLYPLNRLEEYEHGKFSVNIKNNLYPASDYYNNLIREKINRNISFKTLYEQGNELFDKNIIAKYKAPVPKQEKTITVPNNENFIEELSREDSATRQFVNQVNETLVKNQGDVIWVWSGSSKLKNAFKSTSEISEQVIHDENGNPNRYTVRRVIIKNINTKKITNPEAQKGIAAAKANGVKQLDTIYIVKKYKENANVNVKQESDIEKASALDIDDSFGVNSNISNVETSQMGELAQQMINDINRRATFGMDSDAAITISNIKREGVIPSIYSTIEDHKQDTISKAATYYSSLADNLLERIDNYIIDDEAYNYPIDDPHLIDALKNNETALHEYIKFVLTVSTFGDRFNLINAIDINDIEGPAKNDIRQIRETIAKIRNNVRLRRAMDLIADKVYGPESTNPYILDGTVNLSDYITRDATNLDKLIQDTQELGIPVLQVVLRHVTARVHQRNMEGRDEVRNYDKFIKDIKKKAADASLSINWNNIINSETGRWKTNFDESFYDDKFELSLARRNAELKNKGRNNKEYLLADRAYREWLYNNTEQEYIDDYYKEILDNEEVMLRPENIDYLITYNTLKDERDQILKTARKDRSKEQNNRLRAIRNQMANMRSDTDLNTGEEKPEAAALKARRLDKYLKGIQAIGEKYFNHEPRPNFERDLNKYLDVIDKYRKFDSNGNPLFSEDNLMNIPEYAFAIEWLDNNARFDYDDAIRKQINQAFADLTDGKNKYPQFKSIIAHTDNAYDDNGIIDGTQFSAVQVEAIKKEQEQVYDSITSDDNSGALKLIRNRQPDEETYSKAFYAKFRSDLNNPPSEDRKYWIRKANSILVRAVDNNTGKIWLSRLTIDELRELAKCYDALGSLKNDNNKPQEVKDFIRNEVDFVTDDVQWQYDNDAAKQKGDEFYSVWKTVANAKVFTKGKFVGYANTPNSDVFGYVRPKAAVRDNYIDANAKKRNDAIKFIKEHIVQVPTRYYWEARNKAIAEGKLAEFEQANHVYNPYTGKNEPLRIWTQTEVVGMTDTYRHWQPNFANTTRKIKDNMINTKYRKFSNNYKDNGNKYKVTDNANQYERELRNHLMELMYHLSENNYAANKFVSRGLIPRRRVISNSAKNTLNAIANFFGIAPTVDIDRGISNDIGYAYDRNHNLPMLDTLKDASYKQHLKIREQKIDESDEDYAKYVEDIRRQNHNIDEYNRKLDVSLMDKDYESVFREFITRAIDANAKQEVKNDLYYLLDYLEKYYNVYSTNFFGNLKTDRGATTTDRKAYRQKKADNAIAMLKTFIGRFVLDEYRPHTKYDSIASVMQNVASAKYMMFNITGGIGNVLTGATNIFMETFAGDYVDFGDWKNAQTMYLKGMGSYILNMGSETSNNLSDAIIKMMSIVDWDRIAEFSGTKNATSIPGVINKMKNAAYAPQTSGEHYMQNAMMFAMMYSHRVVNGNIMNFENYTWDRERVAMEHVLENHPDLKTMFDKYVKRIHKDENMLKDYIWFKKSIFTEFLRAINNKNIANEYNAKRKEYLKNARTEFEALPRLIDQFELVDGYAELKKDSGITYKDLGYFKGKVIKVNDKIHGIYNRLGAAWIETNWAFGSLIMQYHKHIYNGFMKRWRVNGQYNEYRQTRERGVYVDLWNFATTEFKGIRERVAENKDADGVGTIVLGVQEVCRAFINTVTNFQFNWNTMDIAQQNNIRRALGELSGITFALLGGIAANCLLIGLDDDDDEYPILSLIGNGALYNMDKLSSETIMYLNPYPEFKKTWSNPVAIGSSFSDIAKGLGLIVQYIVQGDDFSWDFQTGQYAGENKLKVYFERQIPIYRNIKRYSNLDQNNSYYKLGKNMLNVIPVEDIARFIVKGRD